MVQLVFNSLAGLSLLLFMYVAYVSYQEGAQRAVKIATIAGIVMALLFAAGAYLATLFPMPAQLFLIALSLLFIVLFLPVKGVGKIKQGKPSTQIDERDIMFSRNELVPGSEQYQAYYRRNQEKQALDEKFRKKPGLLSLQSAFYEPYTFGASMANGTVLDKIKNDTCPTPSTVKTNSNEEDLTRFLKGWLLNLGAHSVGITKLKPTHFYSHKGRGKRYGEAITNDHTLAIAFTVEMDHQMMKSAPKGTVIMESTQQYLNSGIMALQVAHFLAEKGFQAQAHIDGNYEVVCPLVASDAGLGEIGRMGILMTPKLGPRVRLAVVTTNAPLQIEEQTFDATIIDFCNICKKCAQSCPSQSIPFEERKEVNKALRWQINSESCFTYWTTIGTDCGKCMQVCPYSHPNNKLHNFVRWGIRNNWLFRRLALKFDDIFYAKHMGNQKFPKWIKH